MGPTAQSSMLYTIRAVCSVHVRGDVEPVERQLYTRCIRLRLQYVPKYISYLRMLCNGTTCGWNRTTFGRAVSGPHDTH
jgi:hypothetical protein